MIGISFFHACVIVGRGCGLVALGGGGDAGVISGRGCGLAGKGSGDVCGGDFVST